MNKSILSLSFIFFLNFASTVFAQNQVGVFYSGPQCLSSQIWGTFNQATDCETLRSQSAYIFSIKYDGSCVGLGPSAATPYQACLHSRRLFGQAVLYTNNAGCFADNAWAAITKSTDCEKFKNYSAGIASIGDQKCHYWLGSHLTPYQACVAYISQ